MSLYKLSRFHPLGLGERGGQKNRGTQPARPIQPTRSPTRPPALIYTDGYGYGYGYFKYPDNGFWNFGQVDTRPPDNYIYIYKPITTHNPII